jgi:SAM-dependent methyltransferase
LRASEVRFDLILIVGVWQHLREAEHAEGLASLAALLRGGGLLILSLRHGPGAPCRPCFPASPDNVVAQARSTGLELLARRAAASTQAENRRAGVTWTWLAFGNPA